MDTHRESNLNHTPYGYMIQHSKHSIAPPNEVQPPWYFPIPAGRFTEIVAQWFTASFWPMPWPLMRPAGAARWWQDCGTVNCGSISAVTSCHIESLNLLAWLSTCQSNVVDCVALHEAMRFPIHTSAKLEWIIIIIRQLLQHLKSQTG